MFYVMPSERGVSMKDFCKEIIGCLEDTQAEAMAQIKAAANQGRHIWIFGAGGGGSFIMSDLRDAGIQAYAFCDNFSNNDSLFGIPIFRVDRLVEDEERFVVIPGSTSFGQISKQLDGLGIEYLDATMIGELKDTSDFAKRYVLENTADIVRVYDRLEDGLSKTTYVTMLLNRIIRSKTLPADVCRDNQYLPEIVKHREDAVVYDCGAYDGDTCRDFMRFFGPTSRIHCFEPSPTMFAEMKERMGGYDNVTLIRAGVGEKSGQTVFTDGVGGGSFVGGDGGTAVNIISIDEYSERSQSVPTMIKMDIEGSEISALCGARQTIANHKPVLAICVYHKTSDFVDVPSLIFDLRNDYKMYVRQHSRYGAETVAYFI
jgi:FkbM family methyltransferase